MRFVELTANHTKFFTCLIAQCFTSYRQFAAAKLVLVSPGRPYCVSSITAGLFTLWYNIIRLDIFLFYNLLISKNSFLIRCLFWLSPSLVLFFCYYDISSAGALGATSSCTLNFLHLLHYLVYKMKLVLTVNSVQNSRIHGGAAEAERRRWSWAPWRIPTYRTSWWQMGKVSRWMTYIGEQPS